VVGVARCRCDCSMPLGRRQFRDVCGYYESALGSGRRNRDPQATDGVPDAVRGRAPPPIRLEVAVWRQSIVGSTEAPVAGHRRVLAAAWHREWQARSASQPPIRRRRRAPVRLGRVCLSHHPHPLRPCSQRLSGGGSTEQMFWMERKKERCSTKPWEHRLMVQSGHPDSNRGPHGPKPCTLANCAMPRTHIDYSADSFFCQ
jgi:hypothetical protein